MKKQLAFLFVAAIFLTSCSGSRFTSRKYTKGHYISVAKKPGTPLKHESDPAAPAAVPVVLTASTSKDLVISHVSKSLPDQLSKKTSGKSVKTTGTRQSISTQEKKHFDVLRYLPAFNKKPASKATTDHKGSSGSGIEPHALKGFIFSLAAIFLDVLAIIITISSLSYAGLLIFIPAVVLGIMGLIHGTKGLREHRHGGGSGTDLAFSIVATVAGGVSILLALIGAIDSTIIVLASTIAPS